MNQSILALCACLGLAIAFMADGGRAPIVANVSIGLGLAPCMQLLGGTSGVLALLITAAVGIMVETTFHWGTEHLPRASGLDPLMPVVFHPGAMFGPRSIRAIGLVSAVPVTSWASFNLNVGGSTAGGISFALTYGFLLAALRMVTARTIIDLAMGAVIVSFTSATALAVNLGFGNSTEILIVLAADIVVNGLTGWLRARHRQHNVFLAKT